MTTNDMKYEFPTITDSCFVVKFQDSGSCKSLDTDLNPLTTTSQKAYLVYLSLDSAKAYVRDVLKSNANVEGLIYDSEKQIIDIIKGVFETA